MTTAPSKTITQLWRPQCHLGSQHSREDHKRYDSRVQKPFEGKEDFREDTEDWRRPRDCHTSDTACVKRLMREEYNTSDVSRKCKRMDGWHKSHTRCVCVICERCRGSWQLKEQDHDWGSWLRTMTVTRSRRRLNGRKWLGEIHWSEVK